MAATYAGISLFHIRRSRYAGSTYRQRATPVLSTPHLLRHIAQVIRRCLPACRLSAFAFSRHAPRDHRAARYCLRAVPTCGDALCIQSLTAPTRCRASASAAWPAFCHACLCCIVARQPPHAPLFAGSLRSFRPTTPTLWHDGAHACGEHKILLLLRIGVAISRCITCVRARREHRATYKQSGDSSLVPRWLTHYTAGRGTGMHICCRRRTAPLPQAFLAVCRAHSAAPVFSA